MHDDDLSRRRFLGALAGGVGTAWIAANVADLLAAGAHAARAAKQVTPPPFAVFTPEQAADIEAMAALIIPSSDGSPGAREARVVYFMDRALATFAKDQREAHERGHKELVALVGKRYRGAKSFAALAPRQQLVIMRELEKKHRDFFETIRSGTIAGMFANPEYGGNAGKVGWKLLGFDDRFSWAAPFGYYDREAGRNA